MHEEIKALHTRAGHGDGTWGKTLTKTAERSWSVEKSCFCGDVTPPSPLIISRGARQLQPKSNRFLERSGWRCAGRQQAKEIRKSQKHLVQQPSGAQKQDLKTITTPA